MLRLLLSTVALAGLPALAMAADPVPPVAPANGAQGYAELSFGWIDESYSSSFEEGEDYSYNMISAAGVANLPFGMLNLEMEAHGISYYVPGSESFGPVGGYAHLYWRDPTKWAAGAFGGYQTDSGYDIWRLGAEALGFWGAFTLYGQAEYLDLSSDADSASGVQARLTGRYFVMPNLKLEGSFVWSHLDWDFGDNDLLSGIGLVEYRFNSPLSGFLGVRYDDFDAASDDDSVSYRDLTVFVGIRAYLGNETLLQNDRTGAPMDTLDIYWDPPPRDI